MLIAYIMYKSFTIFITLEKKHKAKDEREEIINSFRLGKLWCLICTDVLEEELISKGFN